MDVPEAKELTESPDDDKKFRRDSYLSPTFFSHAENCSSLPTLDDLRFSLLTLANFRWEQSMGLAVLFSLD